MPTESEAYFILNLLPGIGPIRARKLLVRFGGPLETLTAGASRLREAEGIGPETAQNITEWEQTSGWREEQKLATDHDISITTPADSDYPQNLREMPDAPLALYRWGAASTADRHSVALVGSRVTSPYGTSTAQKLAYQIAYSGRPVVSGLARGIDTAAHKGALAAQGRTVAVLGSGILEMYPPENRGLAEKIAQDKGCILSEFPLRRKPDKQTFAIRNRIVAAMTRGTVVVEAPARSGALITAGMAADYGRQVFAVPGRIDSPHSRGCHGLIKSGAKLVEDASDIFSEFGSLALVSTAEIQDPQKKGRANNPDLQEPLPASGPPNSQELKILDALANESRDIDSLIESTGLAPHVVAVQLTKLELKRLVTTNADGTYSAANR